MNICASSGSVLLNCTENTLSGLDKHPNEYASSLPSPHGNQGISKREESVDISLREVPDSEDPLVTISTKYRQVQRETEKQVIHIRVPLDCVDALGTAELYCRARSETRFFQ